VAIHTGLRKIFDSVYGENASNINVEQLFPVFLFIMLCKMIQGFEVCDWNPRVYDIQTKSYWAVVWCEFLPVNKVFSVWIRKIVMLFFLAIVVEVNVTRKYREQNLI